MSFLLAAAQHCLDDGNPARARPMLIEAARQDVPSCEWWFLWARMNAAENRHAENLVPLWLAFDPDKPNINLVTLLVHASNACVDTWYLRRALARFIDLFDQGQKRHICAQLRQVNIRHPGLRQWHRRYLEDCASGDSGLLSDLCHLYLARHHYHHVARLIDASLLSHEADFDLASQMAQVIGRDDEVINILSPRQDRLTRPQKYRLAISFLKTGQQDQGFPLYLDRPLPAESVPVRMQSIPDLRQEDRDHVVLYTEQGYGDILFFSRWFPGLKGKKLTLYTSKAMAPLFLAQQMLTSPIGQWMINEQVQLVTDDVRMEGEFAKISMLELPLYLKERGMTAPDHTPWMQAPPRDPRLPDHQRPHIGLVWHGNKSNYYNRFRSLPDEILPAITQGYDAHWVNMQYPVTDQPGMHAPIKTSQHLGDLADQLTELDLLITVCTATAHLAGAMGLKCWLIVPHYSWWTWGTDGEKTPWYPSIRVLRQQAWHNFDHLPAYLARLLDREFFDA